MLNLLGYSTLQSPHCMSLAVIPSIYQAETLLTKFFCRHSSRDPGRRYMCTGRMAKPIRCDHEFWHSLGTDRSYVEHRNSSWYIFVGGTILRLSSCLKQLLRWKNRKTRPCGNLKKEKNPSFCNTYVSCWSPARVYMSIASAAFPWIQTRRLMLFFLC